LVALCLAHSSGATEFHLDRARSIVRKQIQRSANGKRFRGTALLGKARIWSPAQVERAHRLADQHSGQILLAVAEKRRLANWSTLLGDELARPLARLEAKILSLAREIDPKLVPHRVFIGTEAHGRVNRGELSRRAGHRHQPNSMTFVLSMKGSGTGSIEQPKGTATWELQVLAGNEHHWVPPDIGSRKRLVSIWFFTKPRRS
jgi:hypothetical protein